MQGNTAAAVMLVVLLMAASVGMFFMMQVLSSANPDPHEESHDYLFEGTLDGIACNGTGKSTFASEPTRGYDYIVEYTISNDERTFPDGKFYLFFDSDEKLIPKLFKYIGIEVIGDVTTDVYTYEDSNKGINYKLYTAGPCILYRVIIDAQDYHIVGNVVLDQ